MENLWPKLENKEIKSPTTILLEQGKHLERMTDGILSYHVKTDILESSGSHSNKTVKIQFYVHAPLLGDYTFLLLYLSHDFIFSYPVQMGDFEDDGNYTYGNISDEAIFLEKLSKLFARENTKGMIQNLYSRSKNTKNE